MGTIEDIGNMKVKNVFALLIAFLCGWLFNLLVQVNLTIDQLQVVVDGIINLFK